MIARPAGDIAVLAYAQGRPRQDLGLQQSRQFGRFGRIAQGEVGGGFEGDHGGDGARAGLAIGRTPAGEQPAGNQAFRVVLAWWVAQDAAQHPVDQALERSGGLGPLGQPHGGVHRREGRRVEIERLDDAQPEQHHDRLGRLLGQARLQPRIDRAQPAQQGHGQHSGEGAVARLQLGKRRLLHSLFQPAATVERRLGQAEGGFARGEAAGEFAFGGVIGRKRHAAGRAPPARRGQDWRARLAETKFAAWTSPRSIPAVFASP